MNRLMADQMIGQIETKVSNGEFKNLTLWTMDCHKIMTINDPIVFKASLQDAKTVVYVHDLDFKGLSIISMAEDYGLEHKELIAGNGTIYKIKIIFKNKNYVIFRNSKVLLPLDFDTNQFNKYARLLRDLLADGNKGYTIGSRAVYDFKKRCFHDNKEYLSLYPVLDDEADSFVRNSYFGGWCYVNPEYKGQIVGYGRVYDINSLYPYVMKNKDLPYGRPIELNESYTVDELLKLIDEQNFYGRRRFYYFIKFKTSFELKDGHLPSVKVKDNFLYGTEWLKTSSLRIDNETVADTYVNENGKTVKLELELTMTSDDFKLFAENYNIKSFEFIGGLKFRCNHGLFDEYINYYYDKKKNAKDENERQIAKLYLNNLGGKFGTEKEHKNKIIKKDDEGDLTAYDIVTNGFTMYVPVASAMTSYARCEIIRKAQENLSRFLYSDTDSLHLKGTEYAGFNISDELGDFKVESEFMSAKFLKQKAYIERQCKTPKNGGLYLPSGKNDGYVVKFAGCAESTRHKLEHDLAERNVTVEKINIGYTIKNNEKAVTMGKGKVMQKFDFVIR